MAIITSIIPSKIYNSLKYQDYKKLTSSLDKIQPYSDIIKKVSLLSNIPESLVKSIATVPSEGVNLVASIKTISDTKKKTTKTALIGGICNVDYSALKSALVKEIKEGRLSEAEKQFLSEDPKIKAIINGSIKIVLPTPAIELKSPIININNIQTCLILSAIMLGQNIDETKDVETGLNAYYQKTDSTTADRNTRHCVAEYGVLDVLENNKKYSYDVALQISGMKGIWIDSSGNYILARNLKGELINPKTNHIYNPALIEGVKNTVKNGFNLMELGLTDITDQTLKNKYIQEINLLKEQAAQLKLI